VTPAGTDTCPFTPLIERDLGDGPSDLDELEQARLEAHLAEGCPVCEGLLEAHLTASDARGELLDPVVGRAVDDAAERMSASRVSVMARVEEQVRHERAALVSRLRRRHLRVLFYLVNVAALVMMIVAYVGTVVVVRVQRRAAQRVATSTELQAVVRALTRYVNDHDRLPADARALVVELGRLTPAGTAPYYRFDAARLVGGEYVDDFGRAYRYVPGLDHALVYSVGPDGQDAGGHGDDLAASVYFVHDR
jgi:type II secretory pathway pseudopilin PulG